MLRFGTPADNELVESFCNHPEVFEWTRRDGFTYCHVKAFLHAPNMTLIGEGGCFMGISHGEGCYEVHTNFITRGKETLMAGHEAMKIMFTSTDCVELQTMVPANNPQARMFARMLGFKHKFTRPNFWVVDGASHDMDFFAISIDDWIMQGRCADDGDAFHNKLEELGQHVDHAQEDAHDYYVGACMAMILNSHPRKAEKVYAHWAKQARYVPFKVLNDSPVIVDIGTCTLVYENGQLTIEEKDYA